MPKTRALIGCTGFVGQNLLQQIAFSDTYHSTDIDQIQGKSFDELYCAGLPAAKWLANRDPDKDLENTRSLMRILDNVQVTDRVVLISTIDVYPQALLESGTADEQTPLTCTNTHAYGKHRLLFEEYILKRFSGIAIIVRLPALIGYGLKKNAIFDLMNHNQVQNINPNSSFQFYSLRNLASDIEHCKTLASEYKFTFNLFSKPVVMRTIIEKFFPEYAISSRGVVYRVGQIESAENQTTLMQNYNIKTCMKSGDDYWASQDEILAEIALFINNSRIPADACRKIVVSNIAWNAEEESQALALIALHGLANIEIAPTKLMTWDQIREFNVEVYLAKLAEYGLTVDSFQAITYGLPELELFKSEESREQLFEHIGNVLELAGRMCVKFIVFGSPKNRRYSPYLSEAEAWIIAVEFFKRVAILAGKYNVCFCLEPNAEQYGCDFCTGAVESARLVREVDHENFKLHFDTGCSTMANESQQTILSLISDVMVHVHISQSFLSNFNQANSAEHKIWKTQLDNINYDRHICIEMAPSQGPLNLSNLNNALLFVKSIYL